MASWSTSWFLTSATSWPKGPGKGSLPQAKRKEMPSFKRCHSIFQPINFQGQSRVRPFGGGRPLSLDGFENGEKAIPAKWSVDQTGKRGGFGETGV